VALHNSAIEALEEGEKESQHLAIVTGRSTKASSAQIKNANTWYVEESREARQTAPKIPALSDIGMLTMADETP